MQLSSKYKQLIDIANTSGMANLKIGEVDGVLHIHGTTNDADVKNKLWDVYNQIDPNYIAGEVLLNVSVSGDVVGGQARVITQSTNLNIRRGPGIEQPVIGQAEKDEVITLISTTNSQWWLVRTKDGEEGYCYSLYLQPIK